MADDGVLTDLDLLRIQAADLAPMRGSTAGLRGVVIVCTRAGDELWVGSETPRKLADELKAAHATAGRAGDPAVAPPVVDTCRSLLAGQGWDVRVDGGPSYLIEASVRFRAPARIVRSADADRDSLRASNPGNWLPREWEELIEGALGPWAMAVEGTRVTSICHTPRAMSARAAECGVWTDPAWRGRGLAAAVTAAWAEVVRPSRRHLFYSTDADNVSSQRVAERLGLRLLGWLWRVGEHKEGGDGHGGEVHPLSSVANRGAAPLLRHAQDRPETPRTIDGYGLTLVAVGVGAGLVVDLCAAKA